MARKSYNYTIAYTHKQVVIIPYLGLEIRGLTFAFITLFILIVLTMLFYLIFKLFLATLLSALLSLVAATLCCSIMLTILQSDISDEGANSLVVFWYRHVIKKPYRTITTEEGTEYVLPPRREGKIVCIKE